MGEKRTYWSNIDIVKGLLVLLVVMGHIIPGALDETFSRYVIYAFHMPLFIGISGLLLKESTFELPFTTLVKKYWHRVILPWVFAVLCFFVFRVATGSAGLSVFALVKDFLYPYYHLWYILGFLSYVFILFGMHRLFGRLNLKWAVILGISLIVSLISRFELPELLVEKGMVRMIIDVVQYDLRLYYLIFFAMGVFLRRQFDSGKQLPRSVMMVLGGLSLLSAAAVVLLFRKDAPVMKEVLFFVLNLSLLPLLANWCVFGKTRRIGVLEFLGQYSLPIYLYHIICKLLASALFTEGSAAYYLVSIAGLALGCGAIYLGRRVRFINRYILGSTSSSLSKR